MSDADMTEQQESKPAKTRKRKPKYRTRAVDDAGTSPNPVGRPTKKSDTRMAIILDAIERVPIDALAAQAARVAHRTLTNWLNEDEDFFLEFKYRKGIGQERLWNKCPDEWKKLKASDHKTFRDQYEEEMNQTHVVKIETSEDDTEDFKGY